MQRGGSGYIAEDILQCREGVEGVEGVEQDLCKPLAATNFCSADSQPLPCIRISIARRCTNYKDVQRCTKMHEDVQRCTHGTGSELAALPTFAVCQQCASLSLRLRASSIKI